ncbi:sulfotransferase domain-containing protein [bacterium]|nr:sulfotransferase domain-containing protein [bacterium]
MRKPDFFIIGAPRCGTTAMYAYLAQHPDVFMASEKESHHFATDLLPPDDPQRSRDAYLELFNGARDTQIVGEASVYYLFSKEAARNIHAFNPAAKIIVQFRNPVEMLDSLHSNMMYLGRENISDMGEALDAEADRKAGRRIPPGDLRFVQRLFYSEIIKWAGQLQRYFDIFGREAVHVIIMDDLKAEPARVYRETLDFLGVRASFEPSFNVVNANKRVRSRWFQHLLYRPPKWMRLIGRMLVPRGRRAAVIERAKALNIEHVRRQPLSPAVRERLRAMCAPEVEKLGALIGRDLSQWTR